MAELGFRKPFLPDLHRKLTLVVKPSSDSSRTQPTVKYFRLDAGLARHGVASISQRWSLSEREPLVGVPVSTGSHFAAALRLVPVLFAAAFFAMRCGAATRVPMWPPQMPTRLP
jgi:hypothetical protein